jgi:hypothetical protein
MLDPNVLLAWSICTCTNGQTHNYAGCIETATNSTSYESTGPHVDRLRSRTEAPVS